jgi:hypothetical protein
MCVRYYADVYDSDSQLAYHIVPPIVIQANASKQLRRAPDVWHSMTLKAELNTRLNQHLLPPHFGSDYQC